MPEAGNVNVVVRRLVRCALATAGAGLTVLGLSACDAVSGPGGGDGAAGARQVTVVGTGEVEGVPDTLTVNAAMESVAADVTTAMNRTNERQQAVIDALEELGVDRTDIATTQVSLQPQFAGDGTTIVGYRASNAIDVNIRELDKASEALELIVTTGGESTRINSVQFSIDDDSDLVRDARARAFEDARDRARQYAELADLELGEVLSISEAPASASPRPVPFGSRAEVAAAPLEPGTQTVGFSVTVVWELRG
ncbi:SIMPL domain-containing protein [uncultured Mycolicibacterium sp.]|uniref:SIMPL domain-containing protein n=1 Tax=uncultured Mycolicibacterium sp. TaxID=2320817 RepID=UPI00260425D6|nr:SIMPL domain-containing protein [uncultured Mycolicibacterium sp.]